MIPCRHKTDVQFAAATSITIKRGQRSGKKTSKAFKTLRSHSVHFSSGLHTGEAATPVGITAVCVSLQEFQICF